MYNADKVKVTCGILRANMEKPLENRFELEYKPCGYKTDNVLPEDGFSTVENGGWIKTQADRHFWYRTFVHTPKSDENHELYLRFTTGPNSKNCYWNETIGWDPGNPQGLVYINGDIIQEIDANHRDVEIPSDSDCSVYIYFYTGTPLDGMDDLRFEISLIENDKRVKKLWYDMKVPYECAMCNENSNGYHTIMHSLLTACNMLQLQKPGSYEFIDSVIEADLFLEEEFYNKLCDPNKREVVECIGHSHIDVAWLWTYSQTAEKAQRTFSTMRTLMKKYPEFVFLASTPQLYQYVKEQAPEIYEDVKKLAEIGNWDIEGAMWLEADCNLSSGESFIRQIIHGKKFMMQEFGVDSKVLWLPDVFGYSAALPQILKKCGVEHFVTSKIGWNETNRMPHDTFRWVGIDGTEIFTNFIHGSYNGKLTPNDVYERYASYKDKDFNRTIFESVGYGDGGGGVTSEMLETQRRLAKGIPGVPRTRFNKIVPCLEEIRDQFDKNADELKYSPKWVGELYLELHRGTYTSVGENKRYNRKAEFLLEKAESLSVLSMLEGNAYPAKRLEKNQKIVLLNQFHDVIPGSSIKEVYDDSRDMYKTLFNDVGSLVLEQLGVLKGKIKANGEVLVYNPLGFTADGTVKIDGLTAVVKNIPAFTLTTVSPKISGGVISEEKRLENDRFRLLLDENCEIKSIYDKKYDREVLSGNGNVLEVFEDRPRCWENWEISDYYVQKKSVIDNLQSKKNILDGDRAGIRITRKYYDSEIVQTIWMYDGIDRIDFETEIDWHENCQLLKAAFPVNVNAQKAVYEIQYGNIERPNHSNTSWDSAKFEVCAHKWADISDGSYGASLMNDCKYGYSCDGSRLSLTLLKCGVWPQKADQGKHKMVYSFYPHHGDFREAGTVKKAYELNQPLVFCGTEGLCGTEDSISLAHCDCDNIIIEAVKKAESEDAVILRLYDSLNCQCNATVSFGFKANRVYLCDMLENRISELKLEKNSVKIHVSNFEIATLLIEI